MHVLKALKTCRRGGGGGGGGEGKGYKSNSQRKRGGLQINIPFTKNSLSPLVAKMLIARIWLIHQGNNLLLIPLSILITFLLDTIDTVRRL